MSGLTQVAQLLGRGLRGSRPPSDGPPSPRVSPRISKRLSVHVLDYHLHSTNVSDEGLQLACSGEVMRRLRPRLSSAKTAIRIALPEGETIDVHCAPAYVSPCEDEYLIGLTFGDLGDRARGLWQGYLTRLAGGVAPGVADIA